MFFSTIGIGLKINIIIQIIGEDKKFSHMKKYCNYEMNNHECDVSSLSANWLNPPNCDHYIYNIEPSDDNGKIVLNKLNSEICREPSCCVDGRLADGNRWTFYNVGETLNGEVPMSQVYCEDLNDYGNIRGSYDSIRSGQIRYYIDKTIEAPYFNPNFVNQAITHFDLYTDPMGNVHNQAYRTPINPGGLTFDSFMNDTTFHREDIMERQMRSRVQERFESRYGPCYSCAAQKLKKNEIMLYEN